MDDEDDDEEEHDDGPAAGAAMLHRTYSRPKNVCRKSFVNYNSSSSYYMSSMSHDPAPGSSTRAARLPPYPLCEGAINSTLTISIVRSWSKIEEAS
jgi:hypothetical protein